jgi:hypothetical protein
MVVKEANGLAFLLLAGILFILYGIADGRIDAILGGIFVTLIVILRGKQKTSKNKGGK